MPTYLLVQRGSEDASSQPQPSPAQMEARFASFQAWKDKFKDQLLDTGARLGGGAVVRHDGVTDGPHIEAKELIGGYMIIRAETLEEAIEITRGCGGVSEAGSYVEVRQIMDSGCSEKPE